MAGCTCENWSLQDLSSALQDMHKDNKKIVVPMFQRGKRWNKNQEKTFIDSLIKGYPVGTIVLTPKTENRLFFVDESYEQGLPLDENESFYIGKSIAGLKLNQSAQNPITYLNPQ